MFCDLSNYRLIDTGDHVIAVFCPDDEQGALGVVPMLVFGGMQKDEVDLCLKKVDSKMNLPIPETAKVGLFNLNRRSHMRFHAYDTVKPFVLPKASQELAEQGQLDAIASLRTARMDITDAVAVMKPEFFPDAERVRR